MSTPRTLEMTSIDVESGVSASTGDGFCSIRVTTRSGDVVIGQLDPLEMERMAHGWILSAEAARQDAALAKVCTEIGFEDQQMAVLLAAHRKTRRAMGDLSVAGAST